jgi:histidyl-tRNA synthetase
MVRGLDYYTRTAFEIIGSTGLGAQNTIVGGGRYDGLAETLGGPPTKGFGFAFGLDRMVMALPETRSAGICGPPGRRTSSSSAWARRPGSTPTTLRVNCGGPGWRFILDFADRKMKKAMALADKSRARHALIIGENEVNERRYALKNLTSGEQESLAVADIID